jgi:hypothetical protein
MSPKNRKSMGLVSNFRDPDLRDGLDRLCVKTAFVQKARDTVDERNHLRLWLAPVTFESKDVWVGQISRDIGIKLSSKTIVTHKIDANVDEARLYVLFDLATSQYLGSFGFVKGVGASSPENPCFNYTEDPYYTDGLRAVLVLSEQPRTYLEIDFLDWEPYEEQLAPGAPSLRSG